MIEQISPKHLKGQKKRNNDYKITILENDSCCTDMTNYDKDGQALNLPSIHKNVRKVDIRHNSELINY